MDNWYYFYDKSDISNKDLDDLSFKLKTLGYIFHQPMGLGAGPSPEQIILWLSNYQFLSTVSLGLLSSFIYDVLKKVWSWYQHNNPKNKKIPITEIFITFKDSNKNVKLRFRMDKKLDKTAIENSIKKQIK